MKNGALPSTRQDLAALDPPLFLADFPPRRVFTVEVLTDSQQLLADYATNGSEAAFRDLVSRYIDLVFSTALRSAGGDAHRAQDVVQTVFTDLARQAPKLPPDTMLGGWLHRNACFVAAKLMRGERRRQVREREAAEMNALNRDETTWDHIGPALNEAINQLAEEDRKAILLRFYQRMDLRAIGEALGGSENAAQKRVSRALEKLHWLLKRRGITSTAAALSVALSANAVQTAPAGLAASVSTTALAGAALSTSTAIAATKAIAMTTFQKAIITAALVATVGAGIFEAHQAAQMRGQNQMLQQEQTLLTAQIQQLSQSLADATNQLTGLVAENAQLRSNPNEHELLKLRGQVSQIRTANAHNDSNDPTDQAAKGAAATVKQMKQWLQQNPNEEIPELQYLTAQEWLRGANYSHDWKTDDEFSRGLSQLRRDAKRTFANSMGQALANYIAVNNGQLPGDISQLESYFNPPIDGTILQRYQLLQTGNLSDIPKNEPLIAEKAPVDDHCDTLFKISATGYSYQGTGTPLVNGSGKGNFGQDTTAKIKPFERQ